MATITNTHNTLAAGVEQYTWSGVATANTMTGLILSGLGPAVGSVQATGTFGGSTVTLQGSCDGTNYFTLKDTAGTAISFTAAGGADFSTAVAFIRPASSGGTGDNVNVTVVIRN